MPTTPHTNEEIAKYCSRSAEEGAARAMCYERVKQALDAKDREREEAVNGIVDIIKEELNRSRRMFEGSRKIAPSSYGCGVDWGCVDTCERLLEQIKELITPTQE